MAAFKECSTVADGKIQDTDIYVGSEEWEFYLQYTNEVFEYLCEGIRIRCCRNDSTNWVAYAKNTKCRVFLGRPENITMQRMMYVGQKILDKLTSPDNEKK